jgi:glutamate-1-semialdehyde 2,1-aminomutase
MAKQMVGPSEGAPGSRALIDRAARVVPGGVNSGRRHIEPPLCFRKAAGAYVEDVDGNRYLDYHAAWGAIVLGHANELVFSVVERDAREKILLGVGTTPEEVLLAEKLVEHVPSIEKVLLNNSGSEATFHAVRLARAVTGRPRLIKFEGCYHGFHDYVLPGSREGQAATTDDVGHGTSTRYAGVLGAAIEATTVCRYNDLASVEAAFAAYPGKIAGVIVEPYLHNAASIAPQAGFLDGLRFLCDREGALLIFDEVITGFRHGLGGYQAIAEVTPDLTTLAKAMGNGYPVAALGGRGEYMDRFSTSPGGDVFVGGTYSGNIPGVAAALAVIEQLEDGETYARTFELGERMRGGLAEIAADAGVPAVAAGFGSVFVLCFLEPPLESYDDFLRNDVDLFVRYRRGLIERGVFKMPDHVGCRSHISAAHTADDVDLTLEAARESLADALDSRARAFPSDGIS